MSAAYNSARCRQHGRRFFSCRHLSASVNTLRHQPINSGRPQTITRRSVHALEMQIGAAPSYVVAPLVTNITRKKASCRMCVLEMCGNGFQHSHSLPFPSIQFPFPPIPFPFFELFPFPWDSRVCYSHSLTFPVCQC